jgi:hypothetical protein
MKRIRPTNLVITLLNSGVALNAVGRPSIFSIQLPSLSITRITKRINVTNINDAAIIVNEVFTTIQMPK